jgi:hypothetical protein
MGNKIRVELSHGGGRTAKYSNDPGACFKCGQVGHWARLVVLPTVSISRADFRQRVSNPVCGWVSITFMSETHFVNADHWI